MRRDRRNSAKVNKTFTLVWRKCAWCGVDVRFEKMWNKVMGPIHGGYGRLAHLCLDCAQYSPVAGDIFEALSKFPTKPKLPPNPPQSVDIRKGIVHYTHVDHK